LYHGKLTARVVIGHRVCLLLVLLKGKFGELVISISATLYKVAQMEIWTDQCPVCVSFS
jgi:hypothetical protein